MAAYSVESLVLKDSSHIVQNEYKSTPQFRMHTKLQIQHYFTYLSNILCIMHDFVKEYSSRIGDVPMVSFKRFSQWLQN